MSRQQPDTAIIRQEHKRQAVTADLMRRVRKDGHRLPRKHERVLRQMVRPGA